MTEFSIVVPCYNEEKNIELLLERFRKAIGERKDIELIIVNNGSTDGSEKIIQELLKKEEFSFVRTATVNENVGYGFGIIKGLNAAKGDFLAWTHADLQTDPEDVIRAYDIIKKQEHPENCFVKGVRKQRKIADAFFSMNMGFVASGMLGKWMKEINAQPNVFHRSFFSKLSQLPIDFSLDMFIYYMALKNNLNIIRIPVLFPERIHGSSKWNFNWNSKWKFIKRNFGYINELSKTHGDMPFVSPSLLSFEENTESEEAINKIVTIAKCLKEPAWIHIDHMHDSYIPETNRFSPAKTIALIKKLKENGMNKLFFDFHLMSNQPREFVETLIKENPVPAERCLITLHYEMTDKKELNALLGKIKANGYSTGIAIEPDTKIRDIPAEIAEKAEQILIMSVKSGKGGQSFIESSLDKIKECREKYPSKKINVDGGVNSEIYKRLSGLGLNIAVIGSYITKSDNPAQTIAKLYGVR